MAKQGVDALRDLLKGSTSQSTQATKALPIKPKAFQPQKANTNKIKPFTDTKTGNQKAPAGGVAGLKALLTTPQPPQMTHTFKNTLNVYNNAVDRSNKVIDTYNQNKPKPLPRFQIPETMQDKSVLGNTTENMLLNKALNGSSTEDDLKYGAQLKQDADTKEETARTSQPTTFTNSPLYAGQLTKSQAAEAEAKVARDKYNQWEKDYEARYGEKPKGLNVVEGFNYGVGTVAEGAASVANTIVTTPAKILFSALGGLTGLFGENGVSKFFNNLAKESYNTDIFGEKEIADVLQAEYGDKLSPTNKLIANLEKSGTQMLGAIATGNVLSGLTKVGTGISTVAKIAPETASKLVFGTTAGSSAVKQALDEGANLSEATVFGVAAGMLETAIESIAGGIPGMGKGFAGKLFAKISKSPAALKTLGSIIGEGGEEVLSTVLTPYLQRLTYNPNAENATLDEIVQAFASGVILSAAMQGGARIAGGKPVETPEVQTQQQPTNTLVPKTLPQRTAQIQTPEMTKPVLATSTAQQPVQAPTMAQNLTPQILQATQQIAPQQKIQTQPTIETYKSILNNSEIPQDISDAKIYDYLVEKIKTSNGSFAGYTYSEKPYSYGANSYASTPYYEVTIQTPLGETISMVGNSKTHSSISVIRESIKNDFIKMRESMQNLQSEAQQTPTAAAQQSKNALPEGMGAASTGFDKMGALVDTYGALPSGALNAPDRIIEFAKQSADDKYISKTVQSAAEANVTPQDLAKDIEDLAAKGMYSFDRKTDAESVSKAIKRIQDVGYWAAVRDFSKAAESGRVSKDDIVLGQTLYAHAANSGDAHTAIDILTDLATMQRAGAQATQAAYLLKKMSPQWQLYAIQRSVSNLQAELTKKYGDKVPDLKIDENDAQEYLDALAAKDNAKAKNAIDKIWRKIAAQIPSTFADKWTAWRYMSMLFNPVTHIKNIVGNFAFRSERFVKNVLATAIEAGADKLAPNGIQRTKTLLTKADKALINECKADYGEYADQIFKYGKFDAESNKVEEYRTIFKNNGSWGTLPRSSSVAKGVRKVSDATNKGLEGARVLNTNLLTQEDAWVSKPAYVKALASYLKINGVNSVKDTTDVTTLNNARAYAIKEAQKASYRDNNDFSDFIASFGRKHTSNPVAKGISMAASGVLPFRRTPANILVRGIEYSPIGFAKTLTVDTTKLVQGKINAAEYIDNLSSGLTGTALFGLGMLLANLGIISVGTVGDDKEDALNKLQGKQAYAVTIGNMSFTIDWLAPVSMPLFLGVSAFNVMTDKSENGITLKDALKIATSVTGPLLETSMLSGLNDYIEGFSYAKQQDENLLWYGISQAAMSYLGQAVPTIGGRIGRTIDTVRRTPFIDPQSGTPNYLQSFIQRQQAKIPGAESNMQPYIDAWGRTQSNGNVEQRLVQNFLSPGYVNTVKTSAMETELQRLYTDYAKENKVNVLPPTSVDKYFSNNGERVYMTGDEYTQFKITSGQYAYSELTKLVASDEYKKMESDEDRAKAVADVYKAAAEKAKTEVMESRGDMRLPTAQDGEKMQGYIDVSGISQDKAYALYKAIDAIDVDMNTTEGHYQRVATVLKQDITVEQKAKVIASFYTSYDEDTGELAKESLLPYLNQSSHLLALYSSSKDSELISMAVPQSFSLNKVEYAMSDTERELFKDAYVRFFNDRVNALSTEAQIKRIREYALEAAKVAVYKARK